MDYFECAAPAGGGRCSDNACPCPEVKIPRGQGYLFISQELVDFRRQYPGEEQAGAAMEAQLRSAGFSGGAYSISPILVCEQGAKLRNLDLKVAAADAAHWWATGKVPLRATPSAGSQPADVQAHPESEQASELPSTAIAAQPNLSAPPAVKSDVCECGATLPSDAPICESCGRAHGWIPVVLAEEDTFKDLTCPKCTDILIPAKAVYLLHVLGKTIKCPTCEEILCTNADKQPKWQLSTELAARVPDNEPCLLAEVKRLHKLADNNKTGVEQAAKHRSVPVEKQLAGRYLLHWVSTHTTPSDRVVNELAWNWLGHMTLAMLTTDYFQQLKLTPQHLEGFYVMMHYGSAFLHQLTQRVAYAKVGHDIRAQLILNLISSYADWKNSQIKSMPYDARLAFEELIYSVRTSAHAYPGDAERQNRMQQCMLAFSSMPAASEARGCRKSVPRRVTRSSDCFVATACYGDYDAPEVLLLRQFRDTCLLRSPLTRRLVDLYYKAGPHLAAYLHRHPGLKPPVRGILTRLALGLEKHGFTHDNRKIGDET